MIKTIGVIAANGRSGIEFVYAALAEGYMVRAGVHGEATLTPHENLTVVPCDATNEQDVLALLTGCDAVVSLIGHGPKSPPRVQTEAFAVVANAMNQLGIRRIVSLTGTGVRVTGDTPSIFDRLANLLIAHVDPNRVKDGIEHAAFLAQSNLDWTIVRVLKLGNGEHTGEVTLSLHGPAELLTPRKRVAKAILQTLQDDTYIRTYPIITGKA